MAELLARWRGLDSAERIVSAQWSFAADWAVDEPGRLVAGCLLLSAAAWLFYLRFQTRGRRAARIALGTCRCALLVLLLTILAEPVLRLSIAGNRRPLVCLLFDGSQSMAIEDQLPEIEFARLSVALGTEPAHLARDEAAGESEGVNRVARIDWLRALLTKRTNNLARRLEERFRVEAYTVSGADGVDPLPSLPDSAEGDFDEWARGLTTDGPVTALGTALADLSRRPGTSGLAAVIVFSDFDQNSGPSAVEAARRLGSPVYTVGVGPTTAVDLSVALETRALMKKAERETPRVVLHQSGLDGQTVEVRLSARRLGRSALDQDEVAIGRQTASLDGPTTLVEFPYVPSEAGRWVLAAHADLVAQSSRPPLTSAPGESSGENNRAEREINVRDDFLRLLFVEYEPTWEWRFIKEVFHRDPLVGPAGFRTFLRSADPQVRRPGGLFLPSLTPPRSDFFANDVILLGDMPGATLSTRFCELVKEFVGKFGGGLVVIAGPRFGPGQLADTPLAELLPVAVEPGTQAHGDRQFELRLTPNAAQIDFMRLGDDAAENAKAWRNLGPLNWYQGVTRVLAGTVLAEHPSDVCADGRTRQPLIAIRRYGNGEVVYLGFNETWRLRRKFGERYYRQFWGQMIHRLGLSHAVGTRKRFIVRTDRPIYQTGERVLLSIEAYDENFEPLATDREEFRAVSAEWVVPGRTPAGDRARLLSIAAARPGVFEATLVVEAAGEHRIHVKDPVTGEYVEINIQVASTSPERRSVVRNVELQEDLATSTGGKSYDLVSAGEMVDDLRPPARPDTRLEVVPLWNSWPVFFAVVGLMLFEWWGRRRCNLP
ncbi:MAG TPA: hypothetical protein VND64_14505 [Pirellulales bacterium]|nr:hypothetical protein [Pirellulales bacterium]